MAGLSTNAQTRKLSAALQMNLRTKLEKKGTVRKKLQVNLCLGILMRAEINTKAKNKQTKQTKQTNRSTN